MRSHRSFLIMICIVLIVALSITSCEDERDESFNSLIKLTNPNRDITLSIIQNGKSVTQGSLFNVLILNQSQHYIELPSDYGLSIYMYSIEEREWQSVVNKITTLPDEPRILHPSDDPAFKLAVAGVLPIIQHKDEVILLRILVVGHILEGDIVTDQQVSAFIDVELTPE